MQNWLADGHRQAAFRKDNIQGGARPLAADWHQDISPGVNKNALRSPNTPKRKMGWALIFSPPWSNSFRPTKRAQDSNMSVWAVFGQKGVVCPCLHHGVHVGQKLTTQATCPAGD